MLVHFPTWDDLRFLLLLLKFFVTPPKNFSNSSGVCSSKRFLITSYLQSSFYFEFSHIIFDFNFCFLFVNQILSNSSQIKRQGHSYYRYNHFQLLFFGILSKLMPTMEILFRSLLGLLNCFIFCCIVFT